MWAQAHLQLAFEAQRFWSVWAHKRPAAVHCGRGSPALHGCESTPLNAGIPGWNDRLESLQVRKKAFRKMLLPCCGRLKICS